MKAEGYSVGEIPQDADALVEMMIKNGINVANWAPGELEKLANSSNAILWPYEDYLAWFNTLDPVARKEMVEGPVGYIEELTRVRCSVSMKETAGSGMKCSRHSTAGPRR